MTQRWKTVLKTVGIYLLQLAKLTAAYLSIEALAALMLKPESNGWLSFGLCWSLLLASVVLILPRLAGRIVFGITYYFFLLWTLAQTAVAFRC